MTRFFNTAGPIKPAMHYHIPPLERVDWPEIQWLIDSGKYFVLHAPRQTGKTSVLLAIMDALNAEGRYTALYVNIETAQAARGDISQGIPAISEAIARSALVYLKDHQLMTWVQGIGKTYSDAERITQMLNEWAMLSNKPIVLLLDEVDALVGDTLISLLRQIRAGYTQRPEAFPQSIILCGVRDVRDYRMHRADAEIITGGSAFNIKAESLRLGNFTEQDVRALFGKHTEATGQTFAHAIFPLLWDDTRGQPWLVNAIAYSLTWEDREARDRTQPITLEKYQAARERLIYSRATHLDQLTDKLKEARVHHVIAAILEGEDRSLQASIDDLQYCEDLGLITTRPQVRIANRIYQEVIPRELSWPKQVMISHEQSWYVTPERRLDMPKLINAFQQFFREHADIWLQGFDYKEVGPQLLMQAFLQRIVNGGGRVNREYALGRKRTDLFIEWPLDEAQGFYGPIQRIVIELKLLRRGLERTLSDGLAQTAEYADRVGADEAYLIIFDRDAELSWDDKIWQAQHTQGTRLIAVWGC